MKQIKKISFYLFIIFVFYLILVSFFKDDEIFKKLVFDNINKSSINNLKLLEKISKNISKKESEFPISLLSYSSKENIKKIDNIRTNNKPIVYIYNTHDKEEYTALQDLNLDASVKTASYILKEMLSIYGINSIVEEKSSTTLAKENNLEYKYSYDFSRENAITAKNKYSSLKMFVDLHRDGVEKNITTVNINKKSYAKLMFVLGNNHENSAKNIEFVGILEQYLNDKYNGILRNTMISDKYIYNQDISPMSFLIEVGGNENNMEEVFNSIKALAESISFSLGEL